MHYLSDKTKATHVVIDTGKIPEIVELNSDIHQLCLMFNGEEIVAGTEEECNAYLEEMLKEF